MPVVRVTRKQLEAGITVPSNVRTTIQLIPLAECTAVLGAAFDTNKAFPLPQCLPALRKVHATALRHPAAAVLIVGHTDASGEPDVNNPLSLTRAQMAQAWLEDDVDTWLEQYSTSVTQSQRWGSREDQLMLRSMPGFRERESETAASNGAEAEDPARWFQRTRDLKVDGIIGPNTRRALVTEYFGQARSTNDDVKESDGSAESQPHLDITAHGAGENFPVSLVQKVRDALKAPARPAPGVSATRKNDEPVDEDEPFDRRIEFFFFLETEGIEPPVGAPDGPEYLEWVRAATIRQDIVIEDTRLRLPVVEFSDVLFNTNGAVPMPLGPEPASTDPGDTTGSATPPSKQGGAVSVARVLVQAYSNPEQSLHVAGHTDTTADASINDPLSTKRAQTVLALIEGDRETFKTVADEQNTDADQDGVLTWASERFGFGSSLGENRNDRVAAIKTFQASYNDSEERAVSSGDELEVDGDFGPMTWGAVFDLYDAELAQLLDGVPGEGDRELLAEYRKAVRFADPENPFKGYGERYPLEHKRKNDFKSQANRRVEVIFFDAGEAPDLAAPPDKSELYDEAIFFRVPLPGDDFEALPIRYARLPTRFGNGRTFPKPSCLSLLRRVANSAKSNQALRLVIVGHTDHTEKDDENEKLSLARAEAVKALLTHDIDTFLERFETPDPLRVWAFEEVQWMLHALSSPAGPFYVGAADGYPGDLTREALGQYQLFTRELTSDGGCDAATLKRLVSDYQALVPEPVEADRIQCVAAGSWTPPVDQDAPPAPPETTEEEAAVPSINRRVEVFLFERPVVPKPESVDPSTRRASPTYRAWSRKAKRETTPEQVSYVFRLSNHDRVPIDSAPFSLLRHDPESESFESVAEGVVDKFGLGRVEAEPGIYRLVFQVDSVEHKFGVHVSTDDSAGLAAMIPEPKKPLFKDR